MKKIISISVLIFAMAISLQSFAQHNSKEHAHTSGPYGGTVETASGGYHIEMVNKDGKIQFFLLDANSKTLKEKDVKGELLMQFKDGTTKTVLLTASGDGFVTTDAKVISFSNLVVTFQVGKKTASAMFKAISSTKKATHKH